MSDAQRPIGFCVPAPLRGMRDAVATAVTRLGQIVGVGLALEFLWIGLKGVLLFAITRGHPGACVELAAAVALWPAIRLAFVSRPIRALVAAQILWFWPPFALWGYSPGARCATGAFVAASRATALVTFNGLSLLALAFAVLAMRAIARARGGSQAATPE